MSVPVSVLLLVLLQGGLWKTLTYHESKKTPSVDSHDNNQCKYRNDDHKNVLPILFYPFVSWICLFALSLVQFLQVITCGEKNELTMVWAIPGIKNDNPATTTKANKQSNSHRHQKIKQKPPNQFCIFLIKLCLLLLIIFTWVIEQENAPLNGCW